MRLFSTLVAALVVAPAALAQAKYEYNRDIRPILAENCFSCHGFDEKARKAKLRLDLADTAHAARDNGTPFKPGDAAGSEAWQRIISPHADEVMPVELAPRSIYLQTGDARYVWQHSIPEVRETRWSITFRDLSDAGKRQRDELLLQSPG